MEECGQYQPPLPLPLVRETRCGQMFFTGRITSAWKKFRDGADVAIEALGIQETFEKCLRRLRPGGTLSSLGVYSGKLQMPYDAFAAASAITASSLCFAQAAKSGCAD